MKSSIRRLSLFFMVLVYWLAIGPQLTTKAANSSFATGDVFIAVSNGQVQWRDKDGVLKQTLNTGASGFTTGMAFDASGNLYSTNFAASTVSKFDNSGNLLGNFGSGYNSDPESIVFDALGNAYVGQADGEKVIRKFDPSGNLLTTYPVQIDNRGSDWIDLADDNCTMYYSSEGPNVKRYNVCTNTQLPNFNTALLPDGESYALRVLSTGGVMIANTAVIARLDTAGNVIKTYDAPGEDCWFALNLDPDAKSFWSADHCTSNVYKFDLATGNVLKNFNTGTAADTVWGLTVKGEITAAQPCALPAFGDSTGNPIQQNAATLRNVRYGGREYDIPGRGRVLLPFLSGDEYTGNGSTSTFHYSSSIQASTDLLVYVNGVLKTLSTDYSVSGVGQTGGNVTFTTAPANKFFIVIYNQLDLNRVQHDSISKWGCYLISSAMIINYFAKQQGVAFQTDPIVLNDWMAHNLTNKNSGFASGSALPSGDPEFVTGASVDPSTILQYAKAKGIDMAVDANIHDNQAHDALLNKSMCDLNPAILGVNNNGHFVDATGKTIYNNIPTWRLHDPLASAPTNLLQAYGSNHYGTLVIFSGNKPRRAILLALYSPAEILITDPQGRRTGMDPRTGISYEEIPSSSYGQEFLAADEGTPTVLERKVLYIDSPIDGKYSIDVVGTGTGKVGLDVVPIDDNGDGYRLSSYDSIVTGAVNNYQMNYSAVPGQPMQLMRTIYLPNINK